MKKLLLLVAFVASSFSFAQTGYVDAEFLLSKMPEVSAAETQLKNYTSNLQADITKAETNANARFQALQQEAQSEGVTDERRQEIIQMAQQLEGSLNTEKQGAELKLATKRNELMQPIYDKLNAAIEKVAKAKGFKIIMSVGSVLFAEDSVNITEAVKTEMGL
ncbi:outer membrane protein H precursor [Nonlabens ulvanivorans]|nr:OmpH family outer membrane protein [Nonlabens ulvanivorans]GAK93917.1 outer membrane protein H precursor [Nonlabens ulvanivorans]